MKIECPQCNATGSLPAHAIPEEGRFLNCPRCNHGFTVMKPRRVDAVLVDTCPSCNYSSFGEERFEICPKCGAVIKTFLERQREEQRQTKEQELLTKTFGQQQPEQLSEDTVAPVTEFVENLDAVNSVGWGCGVAAAIIFCMGVMGLIDYDSVALKEQISELRDEQVSAWYVFFRFGLIHWIILLYGTVTMITVYFFLRRRAVALKVLIVLVRLLIGFVPLYLVTGFINWILQPIPHSISGYFIQIVNMILMCALWGIPLVFLERFLHDKRITTRVTL